MLSCITLYFGVSFIRSKSRNDLLKLVVFNAILGLWHYSTFLFSASSYAVILIICAMRRENRAWNIGIAIAGGICSVLPAYLFYHASASEVMSATYLQPATLYFGKLLECIWNDKSLPAYVVAGILFVLGTVALWRKGKIEATYLLCILLVPLAILCAFKYGSYFNFWHLFVLAPAALVLIAAGLDVVLRKAWPITFAVAFCFALFLFHLTLNHDRFYAEWSHTGHYKQWAHDVLAHNNDNALWTFQDGYDADATEWYMKEREGTRFSNYTDNPADRFYKLHFLRFSDIDFAGKDEDFVLYADRSQELATFGRAKLYQLEIDKRSEHVMQSLPYALSLSGDPSGILKHASTVSNITFHPYFKSSAITFRPENPGVLQYALRNGTGQAPPYFIAVDIFTSSTYPKNVIRISYRFDSGDWIDGGVLNCASEPQHNKLIVHRANSFEQMDFRIQLMPDHNAPSMTGNPSGTLRLNKLQFYCNTVSGEEFSSHSLMTSEQGIGEIEPTLPKAFRWSDGPQTQIQFFTVTSRKIMLDFQMNNQLPGQDISIMFNGQAVHKFDNMPVAPWLHSWLTLHEELQSAPGMNTLEITYSKWNQKDEPGGKVVLSEIDLRPMGVAIGRLLLNLDQPANEDWHVIY